MSQTCIERLRSHRPEDVDLSRQSRLAAVLVLLYEKANELRVLLTTRSKSLRAHPGETALPGGKVDEEDANIIATAYREAHEEVGLPLNCPAVHTVGILRPFLSNRKIVVRPVVALLTDVSVLDRLKASEDEVEHIFNHPLEALLEPEIVRKEPLAEKGSVDWPYEEELHNSDDRRLTFLGDASYRMHRFRSSASPVKGLTAEILMTTAEIAYAKPTAFERYAPEQPKDFGGISALLAAAERGSPKRVSLSGSCTPIGIAPRVSLYGNS
ncbi:uncharacterized protein LAESUDRAFT_759659 [Laetiporus sulphureus 93-53]|uniref:Nudix hydrolase domain-containing protein n=1 Tax=Laetiporus sulphureus 93-53 TaxID=1314785 RepID=A0A165E2Q8_9APHY|nr:uncharacterized protein LAESUDRAFT_759659 [Laetiporus sulphureus 93-53]KZT06133.1 hypothetical protein LAESUDRAFT_759659 [Laetiporus sulphureus 93-53]